MQRCQAASARRARPEGAAFFSEYTEITDVSDSGDDALEVCVAQIGWPSEVTTTACDEVGESKTERGRRGRVRLGWRDRRGQGATLGCDMPPSARAATWPLDGQLRMASASGIGSR